MDEEIRKLLLENIEVSKKNLELLKKIEKRFFWQKVLRIVKTAVIIILIAIGLWQIQPYIGLIKSSYQNLEGVLAEFQNIIQNLPK